MKIFAARVVGGKVELPSDTFPEGSEVTVLAQEGGSFSLTAEELSELRARFDAVRRGEFVEAENLLGDLSAQARK